MHEYKMQESGKEKRVRKRQEQRKKEQRDRIQFKIELEEFVNDGILLWLNGNISDPEQIIRAHLVEEENNYMRDYITDEKGGVKGLGFDKIDTKKNK